MKRVIFLLAFMSAARMASADVRSTAAPLAPPFLAACDAESALERLTALFNQGDWPVFQKEARVLLDALRLGAAQSPNPSPLAACTPSRTVPSPALSALDYTRRHVALV